MKLFVGLGNPGEKYRSNRHNIGFLTVDRIAERHGFGPWRKKFQGLVSEGTIGGERVALLKPETYMNESGRSVGEAQRFLKIPLSDIYVFHDELDLAPGKVKVKAGGGNGGHNGLRSISAHIDNEYKRVRLGIGHPGSKDVVIDSRIAEAQRFSDTGKGFMAQGKYLEADAAYAAALKAGDVRLTVNNVGSITHELVLVKAPSVSALPIVQTATADRAVGDVNEEAIPASAKMGETGDVKPGQTVVKHFKLAPGTYVMFCNIDNTNPDGTTVHHFHQGMAATITVQ